MFLTVRIPAFRSNTAGVQDLRPSGPGSGLLVHLVLRVTNCSGFLTLLPHAAGRGLLENGF